MMPLPEMASQDNLSMIDHYGDGGLLADDTKLKNQVRYYYS